MKMTHKPEAADHEGDLAKGEFCFDGDQGGGRPKWMRFGCARAAGMECQIALRPGQKNGVGASWEWDGNREAPTISPSINCEGVRHCGWHGWIRNGVMEGC